YSNRNRSRGHLKKRKRKNWLVRSLTERTRGRVPKKQIKRTLNYVSQNKNKEKKNEHTSVRSGTVRSGSSVRPGAVSKKKKRERGTLITFPQSKDKEKRTNIPLFVQVPFVRNRP